jgi:NADH dehydrogenase
VLGKKLRVGIVGGGATGVELAAELIQVATVAERYGMAGASAHLEVILVESGPRLLGPFPERVADAALEKLKQLGVIVCVGKRGSSVNENAFMLNGNETVEVDLKIWAAGVKAPPLIDTLTDLERTRSGQLVVGPTLRTLADDYIYALGDCASPQLPGRDMPVPTTAQAASQHARFLSRHLPGLIAGKTGPVASYKDFGSLVALGGYDAYGTLGRFGFYEGGFIEGRIAQLGHAMLYRRYQASLHGIWRGTLLWLLDTVGRKVRPRARLS